MIITIPEYKSKPKERHRDKKGGGKYAPSRVSEEALAWLIKKEFMEKSLKFPMEYDIFTIYRVFSKGPLKGDEDNYRKFISDALQISGVIKNDRQIRGGLTLLQFDVEDKLVIEIVPYRDYLRAKVKHCCFCGSVIMREEQETLRGSCVYLCLYCGESFNLKLFSP